MKQKRLIFSILTCVVISPMNWAYLQPITNWGAAVHGIQLSITTSNDVISFRSPVVLNCVVTNSSGNLVFFVGDPELDTQVFMTDKSGVTYDLSRFPSGFRPGGGPGFGLGSGAVKTYALPLTIKKRIKPGVFKFRAEVKIRIPNENTNQAATFDFQKVVSNSLVCQLR